VKEGSSNVSGRRVLVTGGTGLIGSALCRRLVTQGDCVTVLARPHADCWRLAEIADGLSIVELDLSSFGEVAAAVAAAGPEVVFHLACSTFNPPGLTAGEHLDVNVRGTLCVLEALKDRPGCRFIYTGSAAEYPPGNGLAETLNPAPANIYGAMKACASLLIDSYARIYGLHAARAVLFTVYGPREAPHRLVPSTILSALHGRAVRIRDGSVQRDMLYVEDVVDGLCGMAAADLAPGTVLNLCSGAGLPVRHVAEEILRLMHAASGIDEHPDERRPDEIRIVSGDNRRARELLAWRPRWSLQDGLQESIAWCRAHESILGEHR
jgi:nucleoside-diphosphate-sugar epimerase